MGEISVREFLKSDELTRGEGEVGTMIEAGGPKNI
jgi:hypothetical protein